MKKAKPTLEEQVDLSMLISLEPPNFQRLVRSRARPVPEGQLAIAQRFSVGLGRLTGQVPKGRLKRPRSLLSRPFGTNLALPADPTLKRWAILTHPSGMPLKRSRAIS